jgi:diacylglycerol kinase family enzyme
MPYLLVSNPASGRPASGPGSDDLTTRAERELNDVRRVELCPGTDLALEIATGIGEGRTILACGGDGTVNAVAQHLAGTEGVMGVLPGGTLNHFARDLGVQDPDTAFAALLDGRTARVDVGRVDDLVFVNTLGFGIYPELVRERERRSDALGRGVALVASIGRVMRSFDPLEGRIAADGNARTLLATAVFVGNNRFSITPGSIGRRVRLDEGILDVRVVRTRPGMLGRAGAGWHVARSRPRRVVGTAASEVAISLRDPRLMAVDGEQRGERRAVRVRTDPGALRVVLPPAAELRDARSAGGVILDR